MRVIRNTPRGLEARTQSYVNVHDGQRVTLVGVMHVAHPSFWGTLNGLLTATNDAIHLEGVGLADPYFASSEEMENVNSLYRLMQFSRHVATKTGLMHQQDAFENFVFSYKKVDMNALDLVRILDNDKIANLVAVIEDNHKEGGGKVALWAMRNLASIQFILDLIPSFKDILDEKVILDARNRYAIGEATAIADNVTLVWGAAHLKGMDAILRENGFVRNKTSWNVVIPRSYRLPAQPKSASVLVAPEVA